ncbi:MAG: hypothetical protein HGA85_08375 [Nanoarchaeota archaeon]|nr:hypothetical protein [Nanoarchaeota archaeon]
MPLQDIADSLVHRKGYRGNARADLGYGLVASYEWHESNAERANLVSICQDKRTVAFFHFTGPKKVAAPVQFYMTRSCFSLDARVNERAGAPSHLSLYVDTEFREKSGHYKGVSHCLLSLGLGIADALNEERDNIQKHLFMFQTISAGLKSSLRRYEGFDMTGINAAAYLPQAIKPISLAQLR